MLDDERAIAIISKARQKNVATPKRSTRDFDRIFQDFLGDVDFKGKVVMDLGPGQYDFARRVRQRQGQAINIDNDPAVLELGRYLGFDVLESDLQTFTGGSYRGRLDGLFCKFSINAFWFADTDLLEAHIQNLDGMLKPDGWGWIAPWNGPRPEHAAVPDAIHRFLDCQQNAFQGCGWSVHHLSEERAAYYGVNGKVANHALFLKGLSFPSAVA